MKTFLNIDNRLKDILIYSSVLIDEELFIADQISGIDPIPSFTTDEFHSTRSLSSFREKAIEDFKKHDVFILDGCEVDFDEIGFNEND